MPKKNAKSKRADAERAAEWYAHEIEGCVHTIRAVRTKWQYQDLFGCDVLGKKPDGTYLWIQVTAGGAEAVRRRKRKLEGYPWCGADTILLLQLVQTDDPSDSRKKLWWFRVYDYTSSQWVMRDAVQVPKSWFRAYPKKRV